MKLLTFKMYIVCLASLILSSCSTIGIGTSSYLPKTFTTQNIMKLHQGITSTEVLKLFGNPKNISQATCGGKTGNQWNCITWEYGKFPYDKASFTFNGSLKPMSLNDFDIDRNSEDENLPDSFTSEKIMKVHQGVSSDEIVKAFGFPVNISQGVCGASSGNAWTCTTWEYGKFPYERASFTFSGNQGSYILNDFKVEKD
jgi:hypothetical protein